MAGAGTQYQQIGAILILDQSGGKIGIRSVPILQHGACASPIAQRFDGIGGLGERGRKGLQCVVGKIGEHPGVARFVEQGGSVVQVGNRSVARQSVKLAARFRITFQRR